MVQQDKYYYTTLQTIILNLMNALKQKDQKTIQYYSLFKIECDTFLNHTRSLPIMTEVLLFIIQILSLLKFSKVHMELCIVLIIYHRVIKKLI